MPRGILIFARKLTTSGLRTSRVHLLTKGREIRKKTRVDYPLWRVTFAESLLLSVEVRLAGWLVEILGEKSWDGVCWSYGLGSREG